MIRLLICDDHELLRAMLRAVCEEDGAIEVVGEAGDGRRALEEAARLQPDVILLDISMPEIDGFEVLEQLPAVAPQARTVVLSGLGEVAADTALSLGASAFLAKGAGPQLIRSAVLEAGA